MATEISQSKTICILAVVAGCFAVLWPSLFYPMLKGSFGPHAQTGCCHVLSSTDVNIIKVITDICDRVIQTTDKTTKFKKCHQEIFNTCAINITDLINENTVTDISYNKHIIDEIRSLNGSLCLKFHYGVSLTSLGVIHRIKDNDLITNHIHQERTPVHLRASKGSMHPALMEKGRAIPQPQPHIGPRHHGSPTPHSFKPPIPGSRPPMGGMGVVNQKITDGGSAMNILMPMYTIGILLFFVYTMMKLLSKKGGVEDDNTNSKYSYGKDSNQRIQPQNIPKKLGCIEKDTIVNAFSSLLEDVNREILSSITENVPTIFDDEESKHDIINTDKYSKNTISHDNHNSLEDAIHIKIPSTQLEESENVKSLNITEHVEEEIIDSEISGKKVIQVVNMETSESVDGGYCWAPTEKEKTSKGKTTLIEEPVSLLIPGMIPKNSQVLISDGPHNTPLETEDHEAIISSKVTLSLIPDDRVDKYLTTNKNEGNNTTSTQSSVN